MYMYRLMSVLTYFEFRNCTRAPMCQIFIYSVHPNPFPSARVSSYYSLNCALFHKVWISCSSPYKWSIVWVAFFVLHVRWNLFCYLSLPQWGAVDAEIKVEYGENTELSVFPLELGVGQYVAVHTTFTARDVFLANFYSSGSSTCIFSKTSPEFFSCVGPQDKIGHPAGCRFLYWVLAEYK